MVFCHISTRISLRYTHAFSKYSFLSFWLLFLLFKGQRNDTIWLLHNEKWRKEHDLLLLVFFYTFPSAVSSHCGGLAGCSSIFRLFLPIYFIQLQCPWLSFKSYHFLSLFRNPQLSFLSIFKKVATVSVLAFISDHAHQVAPSDKPRLPSLLTVFLWSLLWMFTEDTYFFMAYQLPPTYLKCSSSIKPSQMSLRGVHLNCPGDP